MVEFVSYNGRYPNLCSGKLVLRIDGKEVEFPDYCMCSGGSVWFDDEYDEHVEWGEWSVDVPEKYANIREEIEDCVNQNVVWGCCGGCI